MTRQISRFEAYGSVRSFADLQPHPDMASFSFISRTAAGATLALYDLENCNESSLLASGAIEMRYPATVGYHVWDPTGGSVSFLTPTGSIDLQHINEAASVPLCDLTGVESIASSHGGEYVAATVDERSVVLFDSPHRPGTGYRYIFGAARSGPSRADSHFVADVTLSAGLAILAFRYWEETTMPWYESYIKVMDFDSNEVLTLGGSGKMVSQPRFSPDGKSLAFVSSDPGSLAIFVIDDFQKPLPRRVSAPAFDHGTIDLGSGQASFCWAPDSLGIFAGRNEDAFGRLVYYRTDTESSGTEIAKGFFDAPIAMGSRLIGIRSGAKTPTHIAEITLTDLVNSNKVADFKKRKLLRGHRHFLDLTDLAEPEIHRSLTPSFSKDGIDFAASSVTCRIYRCKKPISFGTIVLLHGGPVGQTEVRFNSRIAFYNSLGLDIVVPDFRGSAGHGIDFINALNDGWGIADVADVRQVIDQLKASGDISENIAAMGASAGGFLALRLAALPNCPINGAIAISPVINLEATAIATHRFESSSLETLIGPRKSHRHRYVERSASSHPDAINCPILVIQGGKDKVVPPYVAKLYVDDLIRNQKVARFLNLPEEGHGWSSKEALELESAAILDFLSIDCGWEL